MTALRIFLLCLSLIGTTALCAEECAVPPMFITDETLHHDTNSDLLTADSAIVATFSSDTTEQQFSQNFLLNDSLLLLNGRMAEGRKRPWLAVAECATTHLAIWAYARYVQKASFAYLDWNAFKKNLTLTNWVWDSDLIYVNFFDHPYHGNIYFNAARSNGMGFWTSGAYSATGALLWELAGEREILSLSDLVATSMGGMAVGETTYRLSDLLIDDSRRGTSRVVGELMAGVVNPMRFINRLLTGELWQRHLQRTTFVPPRYRVAYTAGMRHLAFNGSLKQQRTTAFVDIDIDYGLPVAERTSNRPFDHFTLSLGLASDGHRNSVTRLNILGRLKAWPLSSGAWQSELGIYQHFNYYYANEMPNGEIPYRLSEAGSIGPAFVQAWEKNGWRFCQGFYTSAVLIGAMMTDYPTNVFNKSYNFASGFTLRYRMGLELNKWLQARLDVDYYRLFTWADYSTHGKMGPQGDRSVARLWLIAPQLHVSLLKGLGLSLTGRLYDRHTRYHFQPHRHSKTWEWHIGLQYRLGK